MLDLGRSLIAAAERESGALAVVDGERRQSYGEWLETIGQLAAPEFASTAFRETPPLIWTRSVRNPSFVSG